MADDIAALVVRIEARSDALERELKKSVKLTQDAARQMQDAFGKVKPNVALPSFPSFDDSGMKNAVTNMVRELSAMGGRIPILSSGFAALGIAGAAAGGMIALAFNEAKKSMEFSHDLEVAARSIQVTTDQLQEYRFAVKMAGGEEKDADAALKSFQETMGQAILQEQRFQAMRAAGRNVTIPRGGALYGFQALGMDPMALQKQGETWDQIMIEAIKRINEISSTAERSNLIRAMGLDQMRPLIDEARDKGIDAIRQFTEEAHTSGNVLDAEVVQRLAALHQEVEKTAGAVRTELQQAFVDIGPIIVQLIKMVKNLATEIGVAAAEFDWKKFPFMATLPLAQRSTPSLESELRALKSGEMAAPPRNAADVASRAGGFLRSEGFPTFSGVNNLTIEAITGGKETGKKVGAMVDAATTQRIAKIQTELAGRPHGATAEWPAGVQNRTTLPPNIPPRVSHGHGPNVEAQIERYNQEQARLERELLQTKQGDFATAQERADISMQILDAEYKERKAAIDKQVATKGITQAMADQLTVQLDTLFEAKRTATSYLNENKIRDAQLRVEQDLLASRIQTLNLQSGDVRAEQLFAEDRKRARDQFIQTLLENPEVMKTPGLFQERVSNYDIAQEQKLNDLHLQGQRTLVDAEQALIQTQEDLAATRKQRAELELKMFDIETQLYLSEKERALRMEVQSGAMTPGMAQQAMQIYEESRAKGKAGLMVSGPNASPAVRDYMQSMDELSDMMENSAINAIHSLEDGLIDAATGAKKLGDVVRDVFTQMAKDLLRSVIRQTITGPLERMLAGPGLNAAQKAASAIPKLTGLAGFSGFADGSEASPFYVRIVGFGGLSGFGGSSGLFGNILGGKNGGGLFSGMNFEDLLGGFGNIIGGGAAQFLGAPLGGWGELAGLFASGTSNAPGGWSLVGEQGPELLNIPRGSQVIPNNMLGRVTSGAGNGMYFDLRGAVVTEDLLRQMNSISTRNAFISTQASRIITKADIQRQNRRSLI